MPAQLPYISSPGTIKTLLGKIQNAAVPSIVNSEFVQKMLGIKGGTGAVCPPFLKRLGFVDSSGAPTKIYKDFRNRTLSGKAVANAMRIAYDPLFQVNEKIYEANDHDLKNAIIQVTGMESKSRAVELIVSCFKNLKNHADFKDLTPDPIETIEPPSQIEATQSMAANHVMPEVHTPLKFSYTIYLNLPNTNDISVFNAIFKSLRENLLSK